jgi:photosystem II stability/assembly factor-like uncharacterized protein
MARDVSSSPQTTGVPKRGSKLWKKLRRISPAWRLGGAALVVVLAVAYGVYLHETAWITCARVRDADFSFIFGTADGDLWAVGDHGASVESRDGGASWKVRQSGTNVSFTSAFTIPVFATGDGKRLWAVGDRRGTIFESTDQGFRWTAHDPGVAEEFYSIFGTNDGQRLWAVGKNRAIVESDDGGASWIARNRGDDPWNRLVSIFGSRDGKQLWATGAEGLIVESNDGGANWFARDSGDPDLWSTFGTSDGSRRWAVGSKGTIVESDDGGKTWFRRAKISRFTLSSITGTSDGTRLCAVGDGGVIAESYDRGMHWKSRPGGHSENLIAAWIASDGRHCFAVSKEGRILESRGN